MAKGLKIALIVVLVVAVLGGGVAGIISLVDSDKFDTKNISDLSFGVGGLDSAGKYMSTDQSIYTKDAFECQGLNVSLEFDSEISYQIYFYDQNNDFVHTTGKLEGAFVADSIPFFAKYARIVITPDDDEKVTSLEVLKYAKQLNAKVNREQGFKNYTENLISDLNKNYYYNSLGVLSSFSDDYVGSFTGSTNLIDISPYSEGLMFRSNQNSEYCGGYEIFFFAKDKSFISSIIVRDISSFDFISSTNIVYYKLEKEDMPENVVYVAFNLLLSGINEFYCR